MITSEIAWTSNKEANCNELKGEKNYLLKALSLKSVLNRFNGNDDYYDLLNKKVCEPACAIGLEAPFLSSLKLDENSGGYLTMPAEKVSCRYRLKKSNKKRWLVLQVRSVTCSCISNSLALKPELTPTQEAGSE
jgi:hypothetical protein